MHAVILDVVVDLMLDFQQEINTPDNDIFSRTFAVVHRLLMVTPILLCTNWRFLIPLTDKSGLFSIVDV